MFVIGGSPGEFPRCRTCSSGHAGWPSAAMAQKSHPKVADENPGPTGARHTEHWLSGERNPVSVFGDRK